MVDADEGGGVVSIPKLSAMQWAVLHELARAEPDIEHHSRNATLVCQALARKGLADWDYERPRWALTSLGRTLVQIDTESQQACRFRSVAHWLVHASMHGEGHVSGSSFNLGCRKDEWKVIREAGLAETIGVLAGRWRLTAKGADVAALLVRFSRLLKEGGGS